MKVSSRKPETVKEYIVYKNNKQRRSLGKFSIGIQWKENMLAHSCSKMETWAMGDNRSLEW